MKYKDLKCGQSFQFLQSGDVYIRCRGGYRPGCGGPLIKFNFPDMPVLRYEG